MLGQGNVEGSRGLDAPRQGRWTASGGSVIKIIGVAISMALVGGCADVSDVSNERLTVGDHQFNVPPNVAVNPTKDSLALYMRPLDFALADRDARGERLFVQIQDGREPNIPGTIAMLERHGAVLGAEVYGGLTPVSGGGGEGQYLIPQQYGGVSIFCPVGGSECRARVPYRDLSISIRFSQALLPEWSRLIDGVLAKVEEMEV